VSAQPQGPARLASEDVIINAPMSYAGSAQRIMRLRRSAHAGWMLGVITLLAALFVLVAWAFVTAWYLIWGVCLVPYRLLRRGARKRKSEAMRHRELMGTIQGSAAASAVAIVSATAGSQPSPEPPMAHSPEERIADADREQIIAQLREHVVAGRLTTEEFEDRVAGAHGARTRAEIAAVTSDLPLGQALIR
jgi:Domain of unknown function (DUF1707)